MANKPLPAKQARSRETLKRLVTAAAKILDEKGLKGATIPRIAARAGLTPGAVYRRFQDKDALMRTLSLEVFRSSAEHSERMLIPEAAAGKSLADLAWRIVRTTFESHRKHAGLLRALHDFAKSHPDASFRKSMDELEIRNLRCVARFVLTRREEIRHPEPEAAVNFALMLVGFTMREVLLLDAVSRGWAPLLPKDDDVLVRELVRAFLTYLGVEMTNKGLS
jgi:AcrR family transcriptional regulator